MKWFKNLFGGAYNKALVAIVMLAIYFINQKYGIEIPLDEDKTLAIIMMLTSVLTYHVPNKEIK